MGTVVGDGTEPARLLRTSPPSRTLGLLTGLLTGPLAGLPSRGRRGALWGHIEVVGDACRAVPALKSPRLGQRPACVRGAPQSDRPPRPGAPMVHPRGGPRHAHRG